MSEEPEETETLGHGDHWAAVGLAGEGIVKLLPALIQNAKLAGSFAPPWPDEVFAKLFQVEDSYDPLQIAILIGHNEKEQTNEVISFYPVLPATSEWTLDVQEISNCYGPYEGVIVAETGSGPTLK